MNPETKPTLELAIVVVSYNTRDMLQACLRSLHDRATMDFRLWVVDNASSDGSPEMVRSQFPDVHLLLPGENLGFAAGNNLALRAMGFAPDSPAADDRAQPVSRPQYVLFLNPDTEIFTGALQVMRNFLETIPQAGVAGASLVYADGSFQHSAFRFPTLWQIWFDFFGWPGRFVDAPLNGRYPRSSYQGELPFEIDHPLGAAMMVRAETIQDVGLMDEDFFMYAEEIDWCIRAKKSGWKIYCVPSARIVHHAGGSTRQYQKRMNEALWRSRFILFRKHYHPAFRLAARLLVGLGRQCSAPAVADA